MLPGVTPDKLRAETDALESFVGVTGMFRAMSMG